MVHLKSFSFLLVLMLISILGAAQDTILVSKRMFNFSNASQAYTEWLSSTYTYDSQSLLISQCNFQTNQGVFDSFEIQNFTYTDDIMTRIDIFRRDSFGNWNLAMQKRLSYSSNGLIDVDSAFTVLTNFNNGLLYLTSLTYHEYNSDDILISKILLGYDVASQLAYNSRKWDYFYNNDPVLDSVVYFSWNTPDQTWKPSLLKTYLGSIEAGVLIAAEYDYLPDPQPTIQNLFRDSIVYNTEGDEVFRLTQKYSNATFDWQINKRTNTTYFGVGRPLSASSQNYYTIENEWVTGGKIDFEYTITIPIVDFLNLNTTVFPVPCSSILHVRAEKEIPIAFKIVNVLGVEVGHGLVLGQQNQIDVQSLPMGNYILNLEYAKGYENIRFIKVE